MECTLVCLVENTLEFKTLGTGKNGWSTAKLGIVIIGIYTGVVYIA